MWRWGRGLDGWLVVRLGDVPSRICRRVAKDVVKSQVVVVAVAVVWLKMNRGVLAPRAGKGWVTQRCYM